MNKERIRQAADDYACQIWAGGGFEVASSDSFAAGAEWRINSVWHDVGKELPEPGRHVVDEDWEIVVE